MSAGSSPARAAGAPPSGMEREPPVPPPAWVVKSNGYAQVLLKVLVGVDGKPEEVTVERSSGSRLLDQAAIDAVKNWMFNPGSKGGKPSRGYALVPIEFNLSE